MNQTIARLLGTMIVSFLLAHNAIPASLGLTPDQINDIGAGVLLALMGLWAYAEKLAKGHITVTGKSITYSPDDVNYVPIPPDPLKKTVQDFPANVVPQPPAPNQIINTK